MSAEVAVPAGWYDMAGDAPGTKRWWDGVQWTSAVQAAEPSARALTLVATEATSEASQTTAAVGQGSAPTDNVASQWSQAIARHAETPAATSASDVIASHGPSARAQREAAISPLQWMFFPLRRAFDFKSRACRAELWWFNLFLAIGFIISGFLSVAVASLVIGEPTAGNPLEVADALIALSPSLLFAALIFLPTLAVYVRRLHDTGRNGWRLMPISSVIFGAFILPRLIGDIVAVEATSYAMSGLYAAWILGVAWIGPADAGWNKYGHRHQLP